MRHKTETQSQSDAVNLIFFSPKFAACHTEWYLRWRRKILLYCTTHSRPSPSLISLTSIIILSVTSLGEQIARMLPHSLSLSLFLCLSSSCSSLSLSLFLFLAITLSFSPFSFYENLPCDSLCASSGQPCGATRSLRFLKLWALHSHSQSLYSFGLPACGIAVTGFALVFSFPQIARALHWHSWSLRSLGLHASHSRLLCFLRICAQDLHCRPLCSFRF